MADHTAATEDETLCNAISFGLDTRSVCYLNAASRTPLPKRTLEIGLTAMKRKATTPWDIGDTEADKDRVRELFASMLPGATADDIAMVPCCSYAMSLAAKNMKPVLRSTARCDCCDAGWRPTHRFAWPSRRPADLRYDLESSEILLRRGTCMQVPSVTQFALCNWQ